MNARSEVTLPNWPDLGAHADSLQRRSSDVRRTRAEWTASAPFFVRVTRRMAESVSRNTVAAAIDFVQADRIERRMVALEMARRCPDVDVLLVPSLRDQQLTITNFTGHPSLIMRAGFVNVGEARSDWAAGPGEAAPEIHPAAPCAPWGDAPRPLVRRGHRGARRARARAGFRRGRRAPAGILRRRRYGGLLRVHRIIVFIVKDGRRRAQSLWVYGIGSRLASSVDGEQRA